MWSRRPPPVSAGFRGYIRVEKGAAGTLDFALEIAGVSETVLVTAAGTPQTVDEVSKAVSVVTAQEIEQRNEYSIGEALRTVPGLRVQQLGGPGTFARIQTRGLRDSDTAILVDGLRLRDAASTQGDATSFIEEMFTVNSDRLEVSARLRFLALRHERHRRRRERHLRPGRRTDARTIATRRRAIGTVIAGAPNSPEALTRTASFTAAASRRSTSQTESITRRREISADRDSRSTISRRTSHSARGCSGTPLTWL